MSAPDAPTEQASKRDGVLSYASEWHALIIGGGVALAAVITNQPLLTAGLVGIALGIKGIGRLPIKGKALREVKHEPWYAIGGALAVHAADYAIQAYTATGGV